MVNNGFKKGFLGLLVVVFVVEVFVIIPVIVIVVKAVDAQFLVRLSTVSAEFLSAHLTLSDMLDFFSTYRTYWHYYITLIRLIGTLPCFWVKINESFKAKM